MAKMKHFFKKRRKNLLASLSNDTNYQCSKEDFLVELKSDPKTLCFLADFKKENNFL
jgi:hypothetical protein